MDDEKYNILISLYRTTVIYVLMKTKYAANMCISLSAAGMLQKQPLLWLLLGLSRSGSIKTRPRA